METGFDEPVNNEVLDITDDFLYPNNNKINEKEPRYSEQFFQSLGPSLNRGSTVGFNHRIRY